MCESTCELDIVMFVKNVGGLQENSLLKRVATKMMTGVCGVYMYRHVLRIRGMVIKEIQYGA